MSVEAVDAILLISDDPEELADLYRAAPGLPFEEERHEGVPLHHGCEIDAVHLAIHPSADWPGAPAIDPQSPVIVLHTEDVQAEYEQLSSHGVDATPPFDHGFALLTAFLDPDGHNVQVMQVAG